MTTNQTQSNSKQFQKNVMKKTLYRLVYDISIVIFLILITTHHMEIKNYTFKRMTRFWTMWGCWTTLLYFVLVSIKQIMKLKKQLSFFFSSKTIDNKNENIQNSENIKLFDKIIDYLNQSSIAISISVSLLFWMLYIKSPSSVLRRSKDFHQSFMEEMFVTHFEHSFPLLFLLIDCSIFKQGNKHTQKLYSVAKYIPMIFYSGYSYIALYDFFTQRIRPYPFMDKWELNQILMLMVCIACILFFGLNRIAYFFRKSLIKVF